MFVLRLSEQVVCRACSRNRYPLKYLKDRVAKVCDHCYAELRKRGESQLCISILRSCGRYHGNYFIPSLLVSTLLLMCLEHQSCFFLFAMVLTVLYVSV